MVRVSILAIGRLRDGPEATLCADYLERFDRTARVLGIGPARVVEIEDRRRGGSDAEAERLLAALPRGARLVALDERGRTPSSPDFARSLRDGADAGLRDLAFAIGGADGHGLAVCKAASEILSFGPMVWPHRLARVMLAEQLYRAASILSGGPYHRGG